MLLEDSGGQMQEKGVPSDRRRPPKSCICSDLPREFSIGSNDCPLVRVDWLDSSRPIAAWKSLARYRNDYVRILKRVSVGPGIRIVNLAVGRACRRGR